MEKNTKKTIKTQKQGQKHSVERPANNPGTPWGPIWTPPFVRAHGIQFKLFFPTTAASWYLLNTTKNGLLDSRLSKDWKQCVKSINGDTVSRIRAFTYGK